MPGPLEIGSERRMELHVFVPNENRVAGYESGLEIYEARLMLICFCDGVVPNSPKFKLISLFRLITESAARVAAKNLARESFHGSGGGCLGDTLGVSRFFVRRLREEFAARRSQC